MAKVVVKRKKNKSTSMLLREFTRKCKSDGFLREVRNRRYFQRKPSKLTVKRSKLHRLAKREEMIRLYKLGRI